tara:strand:+ start:266 stop:784 length:519 start_codon:yes stop_codon:yes gene_type:complete
MVKTPFTIRQKINLGHSDVTGQQEIDLGSYTNLGSSKPEVLKILRAHVMLQDDAKDFPDIVANATASVSYQITTQSNGAAQVFADDDSFLFGGVASYRNTDSAGERPPSSGVEELITPQDFTDGITVAVPSLFLTGNADSNWGDDVHLTVILECVTMPMSKASAVALAISQQ